jgi:hypothetical protein
MWLTSGRAILATGVVTAVAVISFAAFADNGSPAPTAGVKTPAGALTVGGLARILVTEVALNTPAAGVDEKSALGILGAIGYDAKRPTDAVATVADLKAMLSILGVSATTRNPGETLTAPRVGEALNAVRTTLPHFVIPGTDEQGNPTDRGGEDRGPGPCQIALQACQTKCREASPAGTGNNGISGCIQQCQAAFQECRRRLFGFHPDSRH